MHAHTTSFDDCRGRWTLHDPEKGPVEVPKEVVRFCYLDSMRFPDGGYFVFKDQYLAAFGPDDRCVPMEAIVLLCVRVACLVGGLRAAYLSLSAKFSQFRARASAKKINVKLTSIAS